MRALQGLWPRGRTPEKSETVEYPGCCESILALVSLAFIPGWPTKPCSSWICLFTWWMIKYLKMASLFSDSILLSRLSLDWRKGLLTECPCSWKQEQTMPGRAQGGPVLVWTEGWDWYLQSVGQALCNIMQLSPRNQQDKNQPAVLSRGKETSSTYFINTVLSKIME